MSSVKDNLRRAALERRAALSQAEQAQKSEMAVAHLLKMPVFKESDIVAIYLPLKNELSLNRLLKTAFDRPYRFVAPRTLPDAQMRFHDVTCDSILEPGFGHIEQPLETEPQVKLSDIDLFLVPLAACDLRGNRLGFGGGFYDRALVHQRGFKLGVGYSLQRVTHIESEPHDVRLDGFISEDGIEYF